MTPNLRTPGKGDQCCGNSLPLVSAVLGHAASKNEEVDQMKSDGQQSKVYSQSIELPEREAWLRGLPLEFLSFRGFMSCFAELS